MVKGLKNLVMNILSISQWSIIVCINEMIVNNIYNCITLLIYRLKV